MLRKKRQHIAFIVGLGQIGASLGYDLMTSRMISGVIGYDLRLKQIISRANKVAAKVHNG